MPEKYAERPPTVDAIQFVGTPESAFEINNWLSNYGATVMYDAMRHRVVIQLSDGTYLPTVEDTDWVTMSPELVIKAMKDIDFQRKYEAEDPPTPEQLPVVPEETVEEPQPEPEEEAPVDEPPADPEPEEPSEEETPVEEPPVETP